MRAVKAVQQHYTPGPEILQMLEQFRQMLNNCIRIGLAENTTSLKSLSIKAYSQLADYQVPSYYKLCAISGATGILRNYRKAKRKGRQVNEPYARRLQLTTCYGFKVIDGCLLVPFKPNQPIHIALNRHALEALSEPNITIRSFTLTEKTLSIAFAKTVETITPLGLVGIDRNLNNVTTADSTGLIEQHNLSRATEIKAVYRQVKSHVIRNDQRVRKSVFQKYGVKQRNRVQQILHHASKQIVLEAKRNQFGIVMEKLTGIRKLYRKGNGQGRDYRGMMNSWSYAELQRQIEYKAAWEGIPVIYVNPNGTSVKCSICGQRTKPEENRQLKCRSCGFSVDRDVNAARNILARGMRFAPFASASEAMVQEPQRRVILKVDADELTKSVS
jgi:putative transposase